VEITGTNKTSIYKVLDMGYIRGFVFNPPQDEGDQDGENQRYFSTGRWG
jgi:hypothetical protein